MKALLCALALALVPLALDAQPYADPAGFAAAMMEDHNAVRAQVGAPPVVWDPHLSQEARAWAETTLRQGRLHHSPTEAAHPEGENLASVHGAHLGGRALLAYWVQERRAYSYGPIDCDAESDFAKIGHWTQMVWKDTQAVGCGMASDAEGEVLVCRYLPAGNICGHKPY